MSTKYFSKCCNMILEDANFENSMFVPLGTVINYADLWPNMRSIQGIY